MANSYSAGERDDRPWGSWEVLASGPNYVVKRIVVSPSAKLSLQRHKHRGENWVIVEGEARVVLGDQAFVATKGSHIVIPLGEIHRIENVSDVNLIFIEVQMGEILDENDIERLHDEYGRLNS